MSPSLAVYLGFVVAVLILMWGALEMARRIHRHKRIDARIMSTWIPLNPDGARDAWPQASDDEQEDAKPGSHMRAQQNGHYSESKKSL